MAKVYVVNGTCGEYSDRTDWPVVAYFDEDLAKQHVIRAKEAADALGHLHESRWDITEEERASNIYDPHVGFDYTGTMYYYDEVEVLEELPE